MTPLPAIHVAPDPDAPVRQRHALIDALRGFALFGVFLVNLGYLSLYGFLDPTARAALPSARWDAAIVQAMAWLVDVKAITVFSLLFGLGFALQLERGARVGRHLRRMLVLGLIGAVHSYVVWWGDILLTYAVVGLVLPLFRRASARTLLSCGLLFALLVPPLLSPWMRVWLTDVPTSASVYAQALIGFSSPSLLEAWRQNVAMANWARVANWALLFFVLGRFLLGYWAGRVGLLQQPQRHLPLLRRLFFGSLLTGALVMLLDATQAGLRAQWPLLDSDIGKTLIRVALRAGPLALGIGWATGFVLLYLRPGAQRWLQWLAPVGRMALSHYLLQSLLGVALFYGVGLGLGVRHGMPLVLLVAIIGFALQAWLSHWWLRRYRSGPMEWLWRALTDGQRPPLRRLRDEAAD